MSNDTIIKPQDIALGHYQVFKSRHGNFLENKAIKPLALTMLLCFLSKKNETKNIFFFVVFLICFKEIRKKWRQNSNYKQCCPWNKLSMIIQWDKIIKIMNKMIGNIFRLYPSEIIFKCEIKITWDIII